MNVKSLYVLSSLETQCTRGSPSLASAVIYELRALRRTYVPPGLSVWAYVPPEGLIVPFMLEAAGYPAFRITATDTRGCKK